MRNFIFLIISIFSLSACLNNDILDKDLDNPNFQESDFYTSGDFHREFGFTVDSKTVTIITSQWGDTLCKPIYTLRLNDDFVQDLEKEWSGEIVLKLYADKSTFETDSVTYDFHHDYGQPFQFAGKSIDCDASSSDLDARITLIAPNTGRVTASIERKTLNITF